MIICEVGLNHMGSEHYSNFYIDKLLETRCDAVTYQIREESFYKTRFKDIDLSFDYYATLKNRLQDKKFGIALANSDLIGMCESIGVDFYKVLSWDLSNYSYIERLLKETTGHIYISTGTSSFDDLEKFHKHFGDLDRISLIHTQLTDDIKDTNLNALYNMKKFGYNVGFGNHCKNLNTIYTSLAFNPSDIWFYVFGHTDNSEFKKTKFLHHPDEKWAVPLSDVREITNNILELQLSLGDGEKTDTTKPNFTRGY